jgi:hypothetical protein
MYISVEQCSIIYCCGTTEQLLYELKGGQANTNEYALNGCQTKNQQ